MPRDPHDDPEYQLSADPAPPAETPGEKPDSAVVTLAKYSHLGFVLPAAVIGGYILGYLLDRAFGTHWIRLAGLAIGAVAGFYDLIRAATRLGKDDAGDK